MSSSLSSTLRLLSLKPISRPFFSKPLKPTQLSFSHPISFESIRPKLQNQNQNQISISPRCSSSPPLDLSLIPPKLAEIISLFQSVPDPKARYQQLIHYGTQLPALDRKYQTDSNRVKGCVSRVWVHAFKDPQVTDSGSGPIVYFEADSDSLITKGIAALLVFGLSGSPASVIARVTPDFIDLLGIRQSLSPSRNSGMLNMFELMKKKAIELDTQLGNSDEFKESGDNSAEIGGNLQVNEVNFSTKDVILDRNFDEIVENVEITEVSCLNGYTDYEKEEKLGGSDAQFGGRKERIREKLEKDLSPTELQIEDISHLHKGHSAMEGRNGGETHFNVRVVSREFEGMSLVKRHRLVYDLLREELNSGLHALSIDAKTPDQV